MQAFLWSFGPRPSPDLNIFRCSVHSAHSPTSFFFFSLPPFYDYESGSHPRCILIPNQIQGFLSLLLRLYTLYTSSINSVTVITHCRCRIYDCDAAQKMLTSHFQLPRVVIVTLWDRLGESPSKAKHHGTDITDAKLWMSCFSRT